MVTTSGRDEMRLATKAGRPTVTAVRSPRPPAHTPVVACHQEWSGRSPHREVQTETQSCPSNEASRSWSKTSPLMRMWYMSLETSAHCRVRTSSVGAWSTPLMAERKSSQARTDSQARALICSREPKAEPRAVVPASGLRTTTVSRT